MPRTKLDENGKELPKNLTYDTERKLYYLTMSLKNSETKKRIKTTKTFKTKQDATKELKIFEGKRADSACIVPSKTNLKNWLEYWLNNVKYPNCAETTIFTYKKIIDKHIIPILGNIKLQEFKQNHYYSYIKEITENKNLVKRTHKKHYVLLKDAFNVAVQEGYIKQNPLAFVQPPKVDKKEKNIYNVEEYKHLLSIVKGDRMEIAIRLAGTLGLRREEICGLKWKHVNFNNNQITITEVKTQAGGAIVKKGTKTTSSRRVLTMPDEIRNLLLHVSNNTFDNVKSTFDFKTIYNNDDYVISWSDGRPFRPNYISQLFKEIIDKNNLKKITFHDLRHTFASIAHDEGASIYDISKTLGHSSISTTSSIYTHQFDKAQTKAINIVSEAVK